MRLLYGKFHSHETTHTSNRDTKTNKRSLVIQFLSSCSEEELDYFFSLLFECLNPFLNEKNDKQKTNGFHEMSIDVSLIDLSNRFNDSNLFDLKKVIPLKKMLGILQSLDIIIKKLARRMEHFSHRILKIICFIHKYAQGVLDKAIDFNKREANKVEEHHFNLFKIIRQQVTLRFKQVNFFFIIYNFLFKKK